MKTLVSFLTTLTLISNMMAQTPAALSAYPLNFDSGWKFFRFDTPPNNDAINEATLGFDDAKWEAATLPHTAHVEPLVADKMWQGIAWYRKHFTTQPSWKDKKVFVDFGAAMSVADVWINGRKATTHFGGYLPFSVDITNDLKAGDNVISVRLDNRDNAQVPPGKPYKKLDFTWFSGLYRNVTVRAVSRLHITDPVQADKVGSGGIFVTYPEVSATRAVIEVKLHAINETTTQKRVGARFDLTGADGKIAATISTESASLAAGADIVLTGRLSVTNPQLWSPSSPNLYSLRSVLLDGKEVADGQQTRIGIRRISITQAGGFLINGQRLYLRGANRHQEYPYLGYALSDNAQYRDAVKIKEAGFDYIRLSHYPPSTAFLDACDELGIVLMDAIPGWQFIGDTVFQDRCYEAARDLFRRDRNHPSVILWEISLNETKMPGDFIKKMQSIAREEFPGDQCITAGWMEGYDVYVSARQHGNTREYKGNAPVLISEYGDWEYFAGNAGFNQGAMKDLKGKERNSRQTRAYGEIRLLRQLFNFQEAANDNRSTKAFADGVWAMFDYSRGYDDSLEESGPMDSMRLPKFSYYFFQSQRDANHPPIKGVTLGPMVSIASWWTPQSLTDVTVLSNCEEVELTLNGKLIARQKPDKGQSADRLPHSPFTFKLGAFTPGTLEATGYIGGTKKASAVVHTPGPAVALRLRADLSGRPLRADGADAIFVYAEAIDANGTVAVDVKTPITFHVKGDGHLIGDNPITSTAGLTGILLQAGEHAASLEVQASAPGLQAGTLTISAVAP